jgi:ATP phosphoribosyltransferase regulatory subunit
VAAFSAERPLPEGVRELLFADAAALRTMEAALRATWGAWGYREIILPTFEYAGTLATDVGAEIDAEMYRFFDRHGRTLALRPDLTIPTARVVGTRLYDQQLPLRIAYAGSAFRYEPPRAGRQHEFTQAGVELIGAPGTEADAESIALAVSALRAVGLPEFSVTVGHVGFFRGLLEAVDLPTRPRDEIRSAVNRKAEGELAGLLARSPMLPGPIATAMQALPRLIGGPDVLDEAVQYCATPRMTAALTELRRLDGLLEAYGVGRAVKYDLSEVRDLDYYTGVTFEGFAPGLGFNLVSGGRYDDLIGHFGPSLPAVGWALTLDRALEAREGQGVVLAEQPPAMLAGPADCPLLLSWVTVLRTRGVRVELALDSNAPAALREAAARRGISRSVWSRGDGMVEVSEGSSLSVVPLEDAAGQE